MSFQIIDESEKIKVNPPFMTIFGEPGVGKTSLAMTMPGRVLLIDADEGIGRAYPKMKPAKTIKIQKYGPFWEWFDSDDCEAYIKEHNLDSLVIDTVGTLLEDKVTPWIISTSPSAGNSMGGLTLQGWGLIGSHFQAFKNRCTVLGLNVCAICHGKEEEVQDKKRARLAVKGGTKDLIPRVSDMIGYVYMHGKKRMIDFNATDFHIGKNTAGLDAITIPDASSPKYDTILADVHQACIDRMNQLSDAQLDFLALIEQYRQGVSECETPSNFDAFIALLAEEESKLAKAQVRPALNKALEEKGFKYDKDSGKVIEIPKSKEEEVEQNTEA